MINFDSVELPTVNTSAAQPKLALVFHSTPTAEHFVTRHRVTKQGFSRGVLISVNELENITKNLSGTQKEAMTLNDERVLFEDAKTLVWFCKSRIHPMWFSENNSIPKAYMVKWPNMVMKVSKTRRTLKICATATSSRPTVDTNVYKAPIWNLADDGDFCLGSAHLPQQISQTSIDEIEACVFDSQFTHRNGSKLLKVARERGSYFSVLREKEESRSRFYAKELDMMNSFKTLGQWL